ncbi:MAG: DUF1972 domain-containing protein [Bacteroidota bacterium]
MKTQKLKLGIIGTVGVPAKYGGFETLVHQLIPKLNNRFDITVYCSEKAYSEKERMTSWKGANLHYIPLKANGLQSILYDLWSTLHAIRHCEVLLILGVSACLFLPLIKLFSTKKIIVNIDGLEWRRPKWNKFARLFLLISERMACKYADEIVTDNRILKEYAKIRYQIDSRLIEYGADHNSPVKAQKEDFNTYPFLGKPYAFKVARIEPENNLHMILEAFANVPDKTLVIVGNWDNSNYGKSLKAKYGKCKNIHLYDPIYTPSQLNLLRSNASLYVHGHSAGGTNPSLVEAMYLGLPVLSFDVIYNRVTTNNQAMYFSSVTDLYKTVQNIQKFPLRTNAKQMRAYAEKAYLWKHIAMKYGNLIEGKEATVTSLSLKHSLQVQSIKTKVANPPQSMAAMAK